MMTTASRQKGLLVVIAGPTASGKTSLAIQVAQHFGTEIISADSRQFFSEIPIGTAAPVVGQRGGIVHHLMGHLSIHNEYNVSKYETEVLTLLERLFTRHKVVVMTGGSGLYIDAVCNGIDALPDPDVQLRAEMEQRFRLEGIGGLQTWLQALDPAYYNVVDVNNPMRLMRGIEVCLQTGVPFSQQRKAEPKERPFATLKIALHLPRNILNQRIHQRTDQMLKAGWLEEARAVYPYRGLNSLNTVGYKELFAYLSGEWTYEQTVEKIKTNTRRYAKRQMTWLRRDAAFNWIDATQPEKAIQEIVELIGKAMERGS
jgi:tRNA dimethylallyltransferase